MRIARTKKERLQQQIDLLDCHADETITIEEQNIQELEKAEATETITFKDPSEGLALELSPST
jgi:hypothetical protein